MDSDYFYIIMEAVRIFGGVKKELDLELWVVKRPDLPA